MRYPDNFAVVEQAVRFPARIIDGTLERSQNAYDLADLLARLFEMVHLDPVPFQFLEMNPFDVHTHAPNRATW